MVDIAHSQALAELRANECLDRIQKQVLEQVCRIVAASKLAGTLDQLDLVVIDPAKASDALRESRYYTENFKSLLRESLIVVNLRFLAEIEGALRAFATAGSLLAMPQLASDEALFELVRSLRSTGTSRPLRPSEPDPWPHLKRLRRLTSGYGAPSREGDTEEDIRAELSLVTLFFIAHEVGHLLDGKDARSFGAFLKPNADLEQRVANAVVRLARHVDDFNARDHGLPGFEAMTAPDSEVRASVRHMEGLLGDACAQHDAWFKEESSADSWANRLIDEHLGDVGLQDRHEAAKAAYLFCRGVFGAALYAWYADLHAFCSGLGVGSLPSARDLVFELMKDRTNYIRAASLFGEDHRHTLTRGEVALEAVLKNRTDWFEHCQWSRTRLDAPGPEIAGPEPQEKWWLEETVLRYCLLAIVVDTAVKLAYVGASASWFAQQQRVPMLMMNFESIDRAVDRLSIGA